MKKKILIFGAGAIGRGFIAPLFYNKKYEIYFADIDEKLINSLNSAKKYLVGVTEKNNYLKKEIIFEKAFNLKKDKINFSNFDIAFSCVGPSNCYKNIDYYKKCKILISCENDIDTVDKIKELTRNKNIFFGIPDVITSNTAPRNFLKLDKLSLISEKGILVVEKNKFNFPFPIKAVSKEFLLKHWICKLYIHNAPHAVAAYLGNLKKLKFIHDAMENKKINKIVKGCINEITEGLIITNTVDESFAKYYMNKELIRFSNKKLFDPISRVAREPLRKLGKKNRLVRAISVGMFCKKKPINCAKGIMAAINYYDINDEESKHMRLLINNFGKRYVLEKVCGFEDNEPLIKFCLNQKI